MRIRIRLLHTLARRPVASARLGLERGGAKVPSENAASLAGSGVCSGDAGPLAPPLGEPSPGEPPPSEPPLAAGLGAKLDAAVTAVVVDDGVRSCASTWSWLLFAGLLSASSAIPICVLGVSCRGSG